MNKRIEGYLCPNECEVQWCWGNNKYQLVFERPVTAYLAHHRNEVVVLGDTEEFGSRNIVIYMANAKIRARPDMPSVELGREVQGAYAMWFRDNMDLQEVILLCDRYDPYDTGCTFNLETATFTNFHPAR